MKRLAHLYLLQLLRKHTDAIHRLSQKELLTRMEQEYGITLSRRTLRQHLDDLQTAGYPIGFEEYSRSDDTGVEKHTGFYIEPTFEESELRLLADLTAGVAALPEGQKQSLLQKLSACGSLHEAAKLRHIQSLSVRAVPQLMYSVDILCEAMERDLQVSFRYCSYCLDEQNNLCLKPRSTSEGTPRQYTVSPYEIVVSQGRYYLICCKEPHRNLSSYRIDRIADIVIAEAQPRTPVAEIPELLKGWSLPRHMAEHLYMYSGESVDCVFLAHIGILSDLVDWFGSDIGLQRISETQLRAEVKVHPTAMRHWAMQYGAYVEVLEPAALREEIGALIGEMASRYGKKQ